MWATGSTAIMAKLPVVSGIEALTMIADHDANGAGERAAAEVASLVQAEAVGALATKLLRTYTMQMEVLAKLKRGGEQTVRVEHVHVYPGGQAIVGAVSTQRVERNTLCMRIMELSVGNSARHPTRPLPCLADGCGLPVWSFAIAAPRSRDRTCSGNAGQMRPWPNG